jgi:CRP-like cAMP-binding protein
MSSIASVEHLQPLALFAGIEAGVLAHLAAHTRIRSAAPREVIVERGDAVTGVVLMLRGQVQASVSSLDGEISTLAFIGPGALVGDAAVLDGGPYAVTLTAVSRCDFLWIDAEVLVGAMQRSAALACNVARALADRLRQLARRDEWMVTQSVPARLARFLVRTADRQATSELSITQEQLGSLVGVSRETVNKHLGRWVQAGWIAQNGRRIAILDRERLLALDDSAQLLTAS